MAAQAYPAEIAAAAHDARVATKSLARQLRTTVQALAKLDAVCEAHGIKLEITPDHTDQES